MLRVRVKFLRKPLIICGFIFKSSKSYSITRKKVRHTNCSAWVTLFASCWWVVICANMYRILIWNFFQIRKYLQRGFMRYLICVFVCLCCAVMGQFRLRLLFVFGSFSNLMDRRGRRQFMLKAEIWCCLTASSIKNAPS